MAAGVGEEQLAASVAAQAVIVGLLSTTLVKAGLSGTVGEGRFRTLTILVLALMAVALVAALAAGLYR